MKSKDIVNEFVMRIEKIKFGPGEHKHEKHPKVSVHTEKDSIQINIGSREDFISIDKHRSVWLYNPWGKVFNTTPLTKLVMALAKKYKVIVYELGGDLDTAYKYDFTSGELEEGDYVDPSVFDYLW